ncbi:MAG: PepSY domain-containing protein [Variibacter sp.]|nr:PepSY domain-containing protein [Variibacter sp.]
MLRLVAAAAAWLVSGAALAGPQCTSEPKSKWLSEAAMKAKIAELGYTYKVFKVTAGNCYEIYGQDKAGRRAEVYFHPITGSIVEEHKS